MSLWRHFKGGRYNRLFTVTHTETQEELVIYEGSDGRRWARPASMWEDQVPLRDGTLRMVPRFTPISEEDDGSTTQP